MASAFGRVIAWVRAHRRRLAIGALVAVVAVRAALPEVIRRVAMARASAALGTRVAIGDVDLFLLHGDVALEDVAVLPPGTPADAPATPETALVAFHRLAVSVHWWPLVHRTVQLRAIELDEPRVQLERLADGSINLLQLLPHTEPTPAGTPPAEPTPPPAKGEAPAQPWGIGADRIAVTGGAMRFLDRAVSGAEPIELGLPTIAVRDIAVRPGLYGDPAKVHVALALGKGRVHVDATLTMRDAGAFDVVTRVKGGRISLAQARVYVPDVGWRKLDGELSLALEHRLEHDGRHDLHGAVRVRDLSVAVPGLEGPALAWKQLLVLLDPIDLAAHRAVVRQVRLDGAAVAVDLAQSPPLPLLRQDAAPAAAPPPAKPATAPPSPAAPWRWSVGLVRVTGAHATVASQAPPLEVGLDAAVRRLAGDGDTPANVEATVTAEQTTVATQGALRITGIGFDGKVTVKDLDVPRFVAITRASRPELFQGGKLSVDLDVHAGTLADPPGDIVVAGTVGSRDARMAVGDGRDFSVASRQTEIVLHELRLPGLLDPTHTPPTRPVRVAVDRVHTDGIAMQMTRTSDGMVLPNFAPDAPAGAPPTAAPPPAAPPSDRPAPPPPDIQIRDIALTDGRIRFADRVVKPPFAGELSQIQVSAREFRLPFALDGLRIGIAVPPRGTIAADASLAPRGGKASLRVQDLALAPFNPYVTTYAPYRITNGALVVNGHATITGARYDTTTDVILRRFTLAGADSDTLFGAQFGVPLTVALALLRDLHGDISLTVPLVYDEHGAQVGIASLVGQVLKQALLGAVTSPLKLVGALLPDHGDQGSGGGGGGAATPGPATVAFRLGRNEPVPDAVPRIAQLGEVLASRPGIAVTLAGAPTPADARWLAEQALRADLEEPKGIAGALGALRNRAARERIVAALQARAHDQEGALAAEDATLLDQWLADRPPTPPDTLQALARDRIARVGRALRDEHHVPPARVTEQPPGATAAGDPVVTIALGVAATR